MSEYFKVIGEFGAYIIIGIIAIKFLKWQFKLFKHGRASIFYVFQFIFWFVLVFIKEFFFSFIKEMFTPKPTYDTDEEEYLNICSALAWGVDLDDIYKYNMGDPIVKHKLKYKVPYIQKSNRPY